MNGGAYNALLNTTSKRLASMAACLTILSYMATAVISASEAIHYTHSLIEAIPVIPATVGLLVVFTGLTILGIGESARVAVVIFLIHLATLIILLVVGGLYLALHGLDTLTLNFSMPSSISFGQALFFGFAAAMLGISGFESSANFVEEQAEGVFPKTLRNMWVAVSFFNPMIAILALALIPIPEVSEHQEALLAHMGAQAGGPWLALIVSVDAALVLSGAVLTSFVGVTGLVHRMTLDRCLPQFLLKKNKYGSSHRIIIGFLVLAVSVLLVTKGELGALAGVYTISFLAVMALFGVGNILLKIRRASLPRPIKTSWPALLVGISAVMVGVAGNLIMHPKYFGVFLAYFLPTAFIVLIMLGRIGLLRASLFFIGAISDVIAGATSKISDNLNAKIQQIRSQQMVFFTRGDNFANLNRAMTYVRRNEHTNRIKIVTVVENQNAVPGKLREQMKFLDSAYPYIKIDFLVVKGEFGPKLIQELSRKWKIPVNLMFIGSPGTKFIYGLAELGGVRLII